MFTGRKKIELIMAAIPAYLFLCFPIYASAAANAPSNLAALSKSPKQIMIAWKDNSNNETGFKIERKLDTCNSATPWTEIATRPANSTNYTVSGLTPNTAYSFRVRACQSNSNSAYSNCASAKTAANGTPTSPSNLKAESTSSSNVNLSWNDNSTNEAGFKIYRKTGTGAWTLITTTGANAKTFSDTSAADNSSTTAYQYYICASNASGNSPSTYTATVPYQPMTLSAAAGATSGSIKLTWTDKSNNESGFEIWKKPGSCSATGTWTKVATLGANTTSWTGGLTGNSYKVRAYKQTGAVLPATGYSSWSNCAGIGESGYNGLKTQAKLSRSNLLPIAQMTFDLIFGEGSQLPIVVGASSGDLADYTPSIQLERSLTEKLAQIKKDKNTNDMITGASGEQTEQGECGGSMTVTGEDGSGKTGSVSIDAKITFNNYCECDLFGDDDCDVQDIYNGVLKGIGNGVSEFDGEDYYLESAHITYSLENLNTRVFEDSSLKADLTMNGSVENSWNDQGEEFEESLKMDVVRMDNLTYKSTWLNNLTIDSTQDYENYKATIKINGRVYYQDYGYIDINTTSTLVIDMTESKIPGSGVLVISGSNNTKVRITFNNGSYDVAADLNGDGKYEINL